MPKKEGAKSITGIKAGRPDYTPKVTPGKAVVITGQVKWELLVTRRKVDENEIEAGKVATVEAYTVPANRRLNIGGGAITCNASCIQKVVMVHTPGIIGDFMYDMRGDIILGPLSSTILEAGDVLTIYIYNNDVVSRDFSVTLVGVLEKV